VPEGVARSRCEVRGGITPGENFEIVLMQNPAILLHFWLKMVRNDVHKAFLNNTMGTLFPGVPAAFQQWKRLSHASPSKRPLTQADV